MKSSNEGSARLSPIKASKEAPDHFGSCGLLAKVVFPNPDDRGMLRSQEAVHRFRSSHIPGDLSSPVRPIIFGESQASFTAMPETAVYKYRQTFGRKPKVRNAWNVRWMQFPAADMGSRKSHAQNEFRRAVPA